MLEGSEVEFWLLSQSKHNLQDGGTTQREVHDNQLFQVGAALNVVTVARVDRTSGEELVAIDGLSHKSQAKTLDMDLVK